MKCTFTFVIILLSTTYSSSEFVCTLDLLKEAIRNEIKAFGMLNCALRTTQDPNKVYSTPQESLMITMAAWNNACAFKMSKNKIEYAMNLLGLNNLYYSNGTIIQGDFFSKIADQAPYCVLIRSALFSGKMGNDPIPSKLNLEFLNNIRCQGPPTADDRNQLCAAGENQFNGDTVYIPNGSIITINGLPRVIKIEENATVSFEQGSDEVHPSLTAIEEAISGKSSKTIQDEMDSVRQANDGVFTNEKTEANSEKCRATYRSLMKIILNNSDKLKEVTEAKLPFQRVKRETKSHLLAFLSTSMIFPLSETLKENDYIHFKYGFGTMMSSVTPYVTDKLSKNSISSFSYVALTKDSQWNFSSLNFQFASLTTSRIDSQDEMQHFTPIILDMEGGEIIEKFSYPGEKLKLGSWASLKDINIKLPKKAESTPAQIEANTGENYIILYSAHLSLKKINDFSMRIESNGKDTLPNSTMSSGARSNLTLHYASVHNLKSIKDLRLTYKIDSKEKQDFTFKSGKSKDKNLYLIAFKLPEYARVVTKLFAKDVNLNSNLQLRKIEMLQNVEIKSKTRVVFVICNYNINIGKGNEFRIILFFNDVMQKITGMIYVDSEFASGTMYFTTQATAGSYNFEIQIASNSKNNFNPAKNKNEHLKMDIVLL